MILILSQFLIFLRARLLLAKAFILKSLSRLIVLYFALIAAVLRC